MKRFLSYWALVLGGIFILNFTPLQCFAFTPEKEYKNANSLYQKQLFDSAAKIYEQIIFQGYLSPEVYFNLGNCYYKTDQTARAILSYERALKLKPDDEDIHFNLKVAQLKTVDKIEALPEIFYIRWVKNISSVFSSAAWGKWIVISVWLLFVCASIYIVSQNAGVKKSGFILAALFFVLSIGSWLFAQKNYQTTQLTKTAVIMSVSVYVKSSPGENNTNLFLLHEGSKVIIMDDYENWVKIKIANGSVGWVRKNEMEEI